MDAERPGPYVDEDGDLMFFPTSGWTYQQARAEAASMARDSIDLDGRSRFERKDMVPVHDHEDWESCSTCPSVECYVFELYEKGWR